MTTAPCLAAFGANLVAIELPAENKAISVPVKSKVSRFWTFRIRLSPYETSLPIDFSDAKGTIPQ
jgi:hypothetical protein